MVGRGHVCILELDNAGRRSEYAYIQVTGVLSFKDTACDRVRLTLISDLEGRANKSSLHFQMFNVVPARS